MPDRSSIYEGLHPDLESQLKGMNNKKLVETISNLKRLLSEAQAELRRRED